MEVSVVIAAFDPGPLLRDQLDALAEQVGAPEFEVVIADNGCRDDSLDVVADYADRLAVRVVPAAGVRGPAHARNVAAALSSAPWLAFCDADDVADTGWLAGLWASRADDALVTGILDLTLLNPPEVLSARGGADVGRSLPVGPCDFLTYAPSSHLLLSADRFRELGGWDESLAHCEDVDLSWRAQLAGQRVVHTQDSTLHYRLRGSTGDLFRQVRAYKTAEVGLYVRFRQFGARRPRLRETAHWWWWLASRSPYVVLDTRRRYLWWAAAGCAAGRIRGSLRHRVVYL